MLKPMIPGGCVIVRALSHEERVHTYSGLDHIGVRLSQVMNCRYEPTYLKKSKDVPALKTLNRADRVSTLKDVYQFKESGKAPHSDYMILDDILTTGTTASAIASAIKEIDPIATITIFTLAKVDYDLQMNEQMAFEAEHFLWRTNSWEVREDEVEYNSKFVLKLKIMTDSFE